MTDYSPNAARSPEPPGTIPLSRRRGRPPLDAEFQRARILAAATGIFIERGFSAGSVHAIGNAAGVTKRTIYDLIGDKEALFRAACAKICADADAFHFDAAVTELPVRNILLDMAWTILANALAPNTVAFNRMLAVETLRFPALVLAAINEVRHDMHATIAGVFADLAARQRIADVDPSMAADTFYDTVVGSRAMRAMLGFDEPMPASFEIEARVDMMLQGYLNRDAS